MVQFKNVDQQEFHDKSIEENVEIIDVRTPLEISEGYIKGATHFFDVNDFCSV